MDAVFPIDNTPYGAVGAEYSMDVSPEIKAAMRAGYNSLTVGDLQAVAGMSIGVGLKVSDFSFDYAFTPMAVLGNEVQRFSISYNLPAKASRRYRER
jgi:hypothetical protein